LLPQIAGPLDDEIRKVLQKELEKKGIVFHLRSKVIGIGEKCVKFEMPDGGKKSVDADIVLMSVGRRPLTAGLGLENIHVHTERGAIVTDLHGRTNVPGVWAAGDVNGKVMLAHTAGREADVCVKDMCGHRDRIRYETIPSVIYTHPEVASVGLNEDEAREKGYAVAVSKMPFTYSGRFWAETKRGEQSLCKAVFDTDGGALLGVQCVGPSSSEIIAAAAIMIENEMTVDDVEEIVFPHPTIAEMIKETIIAAGPVKKAESAEAGATVQ
jgi:dihydrolipoamide dehydrogenase